MRHGEKAVKRQHVKNILAPFPTGDAGMFLSKLVPPQAVLSGPPTSLHRQEQRERGTILREPISLGLNSEEVPVNQR